MAAVSATACGSNMKSIQESQDYYKVRESVFITGGLYIREDRVEGNYTKQESWSLAEGPPQEGRSLHTCPGSLFQPHPGPQAGCKSQDGLALGTGIISPKLGSSVSQRS